MGSVLGVVACGAVMASAMVGASCTPTLELPKAPASCDLQVVSMSIISSPRINPTIDGEPRPVQVRIYQLKNDVRLQNASFDKIWKDDKNTLQDDLVKVDELPVYPDTRTDVRFERDEAAQNVVGVALFRNPKGRSWFTSFELPAAPSKGQCGMISTCDDPNGCDGGPVWNPRFTVWVDATRIDNGEDHEDDTPDGGRVRVTRFTLAKPVTPPPPGSGAPSAPGGGAPK